MTGAPSMASAEQLKELHVANKPVPEKVSAAKGGAG